MIKKAVRIKYAVFFLILILSLPAAAHEKKSEESSRAKRSRIGRPMDALILYQKGKTDEAISLLQKNIQQGRYRYDSHITLGSIYLNTGRYEEALLNFKKASGLRPKVVSTHYAMAMIYEKIREHKKSIRAWKRYLKHKDIDKESRKIAQKHLAHQQAHLAEHPRNEKGGKK